MKMKLCVSVATIGAVAFVLGCSGTKFKSAKPTSSEKPADPGAPGDKKTVGSEIDQNGRKPGDGTPNTGGPGSPPTVGGPIVVPGTVAGTKETCTDNYRALRIALVIDNTGSNNCNKNGEIQNPNFQTGESYCGTDPVKGNSPRPDGKGFTDRQNAIFQTVVRVAELDKKAIEKNSAFLGTELGLLSFPLDASFAGLGQNKFYSGNFPVLPKTMTNTKEITVDEKYKTDLWELLTFTHRPDGMTPYRTALEGAKKLLRDTKQPGDQRLDVVLFITDGLPTDQQPSLVRKAREDIKDIPVYLMSIYSPGADAETQNAPAKKSLSDAWNDPTKRWGHVDGANDGFANFDAYWSALLKLPKELATGDVINIQGSENLTKEIDRVLGVLQSCTVP